MDYIDFSKDCCRMQIKSTKNGIMMQRGVFYLNSFLAALEGYWLYQEPTHIFTAVVGGAIIGNVLWVAMQLSSMKQDLKFDKERLIHLDKLSEDKNFQGMLQQLKNSKEHYDKIIASVVKRDHIVDAKSYFSAAYRENMQQESTSPKVEK